MGCVFGVCIGVYRMYIEDYRGRVGVEWGYVYRRALWWLLLCVLEELVCGMSS